MTSPDLPNSVVVLDSLGSLPRTTNLGTGSGHATLLSLTPRHDHLRSLGNRLARSFEQVEVVHGARHLDAIALDLRHEFARLVALAAEEIKVGESTLRKAHVFEKQLSLWWLNEIFGRRSDLYSGFTRLCQLELIRKLTRRQDLENLYLITNDLQFWRVVRSLCRQKELAFRGRRPWSPIGWMRKSALPRVVLSSLVWFARVGVQTFLARTVARPQVLRGSETRPLCVFHTIYPLLWGRDNPTMDEKYESVPRLLDEGGRFRSAYAFTFSSDGRHQHVTVRQFWRLCRRLKSQGSQLGGLPGFLLDGYPRLRDLLATAAQMRLIFSYFRLERSRSFRRHWKLGGVPFYPLLRDELRAAMVRTPRYLLHGLRVRRFVQEIRPRALVYYHFDFGFGRAVAFGSLTGRPETVLVGAQEGPIAKRKLWSTYHPGELRFGEDDRLDFMSGPPVPDIALLEGRSALECLIEAGYPENRLFCLGAPRLTRLRDLPRWQMRRPRDDRGPEGRDTLVALVVLGSNDADSLLDVCLSALDEMPHVHFIFKLHPRGGLSRAGAERRIASHDTRRARPANFSVETDATYRLLGEADLVLASYSSVAMEAAALGYPLACLVLSDRITASPLLDVPAPRVQFVTNRSEFMEVLQRDLPPTDDETQHTGSDLEDYFFHKLDGLSSQRWARAIEDFLLAHNSKPGESDPSRN